jgi:hypothetical protein
MRVKTDEEMKKREGKREKGRGDREIGRRVTEVIKEGVKKIKRDRVIEVIETRRRGE